MSGSGRDGETLDVLQQGRTSGAAKLADVDGEGEVGLDKSQNQILDGDSVDAHQWDIDSDSAEQGVKESAGCRTVVAVTEGQVANIENLVQLTYNTNEERLANHTITCYHVSQSV